MLSPIFGTGSAARPPSHHRFYRSSSRDELPHLLFLYHSSHLTTLECSQKKIMADHKTCLPLTPDSIKEAHSIIKPYIHRTPVLTSATLDRIASTPSGPGSPTPRFRLFFKCENYQKIGAFKARGAFHAVKHLIKELGLEEVRRRGVVTHSSGTPYLGLGGQIVTGLAIADVFFSIKETMRKPLRLLRLPSPSLAT